ncbi:DgyrCDS8100 [Dimorphilus gyrociliatus]|uniref:Glutaredoxin-1 n=1 Tax=Dimorphilus gyrociliatus TaxID=2664684 RepID=A0A7I8VTC2_9ANNE|nr:DgyrCDS8100 [Dimorphilus gyrociliatus]
MAGAQEFVEQKIKEKKVTIFVKTWCPYCVKAMKVFKELINNGDLDKSDYEEVDIENLKDVKCGDIQDYMAQKTGARSVPRCFINANFIGGGDDVVRLNSQKKLATMLKS